MPRVYSHPYIMDITQVQRKLDGEHPIITGDPLEPEKLRGIIEEFVKLEAHCDDAKALCSYNIGQIISSGKVESYPKIKVPDPPDNN